MTCNSNSYYRIRLIWLVMLLLVGTASGCISTNLYLATSQRESNATPVSAYVLADGALAIECRVDIGYRTITRETRYLVIAHHEITRRITNAQDKAGPRGLAHIYLSTDTPYRYVTLSHNSSGQAEPMPDLLANAGPPIPLRPADRDVPEIMYYYGSLAAVIERKGLLREESDHSTRSAGGNVVFALAILPAVAADIVTSPIQLGVAIAYYVSVKRDFNLQPVGL